MNVRFLIDHKILKAQLRTSCEWKFPFLPRVGERIEDSILVNGITPEQCYNLLKEDKKKLWDEEVYYHVEYGRSEKEAQLIVLSNHLNGMNLAVAATWWGADKVDLLLYEAGIEF